jgi:hypothetical protein
VLESIIKDKIMLHISSQHLNDPYQHGFAPKRSVISNLVISDSILAHYADGGIPVDMILFDFSKAFDRVPHRLLLHQLSSLCVGGKFLTWINNFLSARYQRVAIGGHYSDPLPVTSGVVQGSVLGPALFSIYVSSISQCIKHAHYLFYADDLKLILPIQSVDARSALQNDLDRLHQWAKSWGMTFNISKCHVMHFGRNNPMFNYKLGDDDLLAIESSDDLGLLREAAKLGRYELHTARVIKKAFNAMFLILQGLSSRRKELMRNVFTCYIQPIIDFAAILWYPHSTTACCRVERVQRVFTKLIAGFKFISYERRLFLLHMHAVSTRVKMSKIILLYKIIHGLIDIDLRLLNLSINTNNTRASGLRLVLPVPLFVFIYCCTFVE